MGLFKRFVGYLGFGSQNDEVEDTKIDDLDYNNNNNHNYNNNLDYSDPIPTGPRRGFAVPVQVPVDRHLPGPVLLPSHGHGGLQGLRWYAARLKTDEDGDVADEFLNEVSPEMSSSTPQDDTQPLPRFQVKPNTKRAKVKNQVITSDGKLQHCVDYQGQ